MLLRICKQNMIEQTNGLPLSLVQLEGAAMYALLGAGMLWLAASASNPVAASA